MPCPGHIWMHHCFPQVKKKKNRVLYVNCQLSQWLDIYMSCWSCPCCPRDYVVLVCSSTLACLVAVLLSFIWQQAS